MTARFTALSALCFLNDYFLTATTCDDNQVTDSIFFTFSIFEPHTEWVSKSKARVPVELGIKVCILEDQHQFILHHHVVTKQTDACVAVDMVTETRRRFSSLNTCSFDKGFHSPANQTALAQLLDHTWTPTFCQAFNQ